MPALWTSAGIAVARSGCAIRLRSLPALDGVVHPLSTCDHHTRHYLSIMSPLAVMWTARAVMGEAALRRRPSHGLLPSNPQQSSALSGPSCRNAPAVIFIYT